MNLAPQWHPVGAEKDFPTGITAVKAGSKAVLLLRAERGWFAFDSLCPHVGGPMARCEVNDVVVSCPLHGWSFDLTDNGREIHGYRPLRTYRVRCDGGTVVILV